MYNIACNFNEGVLLPETERYNKKWKVPRHNSKNGIQYGFGQANVWYALEPEAEKYVKELVTNIYGYSGENACNSSDIEVQ